jgi:prolipoprotein diacylglyceryltransferase
MMIGNHIFDRMATTKIRIIGRRLPAFQFCGYFGVAAAVALSMALVGKTGLSYLVMGGIVGTAMLTFLGLVALTKVITGEEQIIYYHHEIAVMLVTMILVKALGHPVMPYLEITLLGVGMFLACGRVGCLMVGCCHGRPCAWGIRYREEHAAEGLAPYLAGLRLFPIQIVESLWVLIVVICGAALILRGHAPGTALAWYTVAYGSARFALEFFRGDTDRPYTWGFSQGQWLSLWLMSALIAAEFQGQIPFVRWHVAVVACVIVAMPLVALRRKFDRTRKFRLFHPHHVHEVAEVLRRADLATSAGTGNVMVSTTSMGLQISAVELHARHADICEYAFSCREGGMEHDTALMLAGLVMQLRRSRGSPELLSGTSGVYHLVVRKREELAA